MGGWAGTRRSYRNAGSSVNPERQAGPHAHFIQVTRDNRFAITADLDSTSCSCTVRREDRSLTPGTPGSPRWSPARATPFPPTSPSPVGEVRLRGERAEPRRVAGPPPSGGRSSSTSTRSGTPERARRPPRRVGELDLRGAARRLAARRGGPQDRAQVPRPRPRLEAPRSAPSSSSPRGRPRVTPPARRRSRRERLRVRRHRLPLARAPHAERARRREGRRDPAAVRVLTRSRGSPTS